MCYTSGTCMRTCISIMMYQCPWYTLFLGVSLFLFTYIIHTYVHRCVNVHTYMYVSVVTLVYVHVCTYFWSWWRTVGYSKENLYRDSWWYCRYSTCPMYMCVHSKACCTYMYVCMNTTNSLVLGIEGRTCMGCAKNLQRIETCTYVHVRTCGCTCM